MKKNSVEDINAKAMLLVEQKSYAKMETAEELLNCYIPLIRSMYSKDFWNDAAADMEDHTQSLLLYFLKKTLEYDPTITPDYHAYIVQHLRYMRLEIYAAERKWRERTGKYCAEVDLDYYGNVAENAIENVSELEKYRSIKDGRLRLMKIYYEIYGFTMQEIAEIFDCTATTVFNNLRNRNSRGGKRRGRGNEPQG